MFYVWPQKGDSKTFHPSMQLLQFYYHISLIIHYECVNWFHKKTRDYFNNELKFGRDFISSWDTQWTDSHSSQQEMLFFLIHSKSWHNFTKTKTHSPFLSRSNGRKKILLLSAYCICCFAFEKQNLFLTFCNVWKYTIDSKQFHGFAIQNIHKFSAHFALFRLLIYFWIVIICVYMIVNEYALIGIEETNWVSL